MPTTSASVGMESNGHNSTSTPITSLHYRASPDPVRLRFAAANSRLSREKSVDVPLEAVGILHDQSADLRIEIAGAGAEYDTLRALGHTLGLDDTACFLGRRHDVVELMRRAEMVICPSRDDAASLTVLRRTTVLRRYTFSRQLSSTRNLYHQLIGSASVAQAMGPTGDDPALSRAADEPAEAVPDRCQSRSRRHRERMEESPQRCEQKSDHPVHHSPRPRATIRKTRDQPGWSSDLMPEAICRVAA